MKSLRESELEGDDRQKGLSAFPKRIDRIEARWWEFWEMSRNWIMAGVAAVCFVSGVALSYRIEPGVRVQNVTLAEDTPAIPWCPVQ